ncbi:hypothetical protein [Rugamonas aquatica]|uniref:Uncharacterized protein n=1 Tax=Rugamonas aquatica TaxID=2743357 RepID=A0A6A7N205_9BURK|nr:hypothetical protein [Rugamonas aquatica]MQA39017.1 hypothetical protein [Rugamonas aquatica]
MLLDYGKKFTDMWGSADMDVMITHWSRELGAYSDVELQRGWQAMERMNWPPSLPEFKALCRPPVDPMVAFHEAQAGMLARVAGRMGEWSHPAVFWAAQQLGAVVTDQLYSTVRPRWERALADSMAKGEWAAIPVPMVALPAPGRTRLADSVAKQRLAELKASGVLKREPSPDTRLDWARKIVAAEANGDRTVELYSLKLAQAALERG